MIYKILHRKLKMEQHQLTKGITFVYRMTAIIKDCYYY